MSTFKAKPRSPFAVDVKVSRQALAVDLADGRSLIVPVAWYPRLLHATPAERNHWRLIGGGEGIHWPDLDEDISVEGLLAGLPSGESPTSFKRWLATRETRRIKAPSRSAGAGKVSDRPAGKKRSTRLRRRPIPDGGVMAGRGRRRRRTVMDRRTDVSLQIPRTIIAVDPDGNPILVDQHV